MRVLVLAFALAVPLLAVAQSAPPMASLDRTRVGVGETVTLNIEVGEDATDPPDLAPLSADFIMLGTSTNHSLSIVNGRREARTIFGIALRPRHEGRLTVPALNVGSQRTQPVTVDVEASSDNSPAAADRPVLLEGKVDPTHAYVGQQIDYTLRLYFAVNLADGQLGDPSAEGAEIRRVGQDANYQTERGGRRFNVVERHYAMFPQHAGTLDIQPPTFQGTAVDPTDAGSFFGAGSPVNATADRIRVDVRARPSSAGDNAWIPARELHLALEGLPADGKARVGQPITLTMRLDAVGMPFEALPALSLPTIDGADVYPDKAVTGGGASGPWITGRRQQGFAVVPTRSGTLHIPETTLHWWNVATDKAEVATVPAHDIQVAAGTGALARPSSTATATAPGAVAAPAGTPPSPAAGPPWRWLFAGAIALWLLTLVAWFVFSRRRSVSPPMPPPTREPLREKPARDAFLVAAASGDAAAADHRLLAWARVSRPALRSTGALAAALKPGAQRDAIDRLQQARFAAAPLDGKGLAMAFGKGFDWLPPPGAARNDGLPPLYPG